MELSKLHFLLESLKGKLSVPERIYKLQQPVDGISEFQFSFAPPINMDAVDDVERRTGYRLPADYKEFLLLHNGASLFVDAPHCTQGVSLGPIADIIQYHLEYAPQDSSYRTVYPPELCMIGSYFGFGDYFLIDTSVPEGTMMALTRYKLRNLEMSFTDWLDLLIANDGRRFWV